MLFCQSRAPWAFVLALALVVAVAPQSWAGGRESACRVTLRSKGASRAWDARVREVQTWLDADAEEGLDCGDVLVLAEGARGTIVFSTTDGRRATRHVAGPEQLRAMVHALATTFPEESLDGPAPAVGPERSAREEAAPIGAGAHAPPPPVKPPDETSASWSAGRVGPGLSRRVLVEASAGMRVGPASPGVWWSAVSLALAAGVRLGRAEAGVWGRYEPSYSLVGQAAPPGLSMWTSGGGVWAGYVLPLGKVDLEGRVTGSMVLGYEMSDNLSGQIAARPLEPHVGLLAAAVLPASALVRLRLELGFDAAASRLGPLPTGDDGLYWPWWTGTAGVGVDWNAL